MFWKTSTRGFRPETVRADSPSEWTAVAAQALGRLVQAEDAIRDRRGCGSPRPPCRKAASPRNRSRPDRRRARFVRARSRCAPARHPRRSGAAPTCCGRSSRRGRRRNRRQNRDARASRSSSGQHIAIFAGAAPRFRARRDGAPLQLTSSAHLLTHFANSLRRQLLRPPENLGRAAAVRGRGPIHHADLVAAGDAHDEAHLFRYHVDADVPARRTGNSPPPSRPRAFAAATPRSAPAEPPPGCRRRAGPG